MFYYIIFSTIDIIVKTHNHISIVGKASNKTDQPSVQIEIYNIPQNKLIWEVRKKRNSPIITTLIACFGD